jgi:hypothetical protein
MTNISNNASPGLPLLSPQSLRPTQTAKMLRRHSPLSNKHLLVSDSDTESDNPSSDCDSETLKQNKKGCQKRKTTKKEKIVVEESSRNVKALKEDPG